MEGTVDDYLRKLAEKAIRQGLQQGLEQGRAEVVARIVADGSLSREQIAGVLGLTPEEVDACIESMPRKLLDGVIGTAVDSAG